MGLAKMVQTATVNTMPSVIHRRMSVAVLGQPVKSEEQGKHRVREMSKV